MSYEDQVLGNHISRCLAYNKACESACGVHGARKELGVLVTNARMIEVGVTRHNDNVATVLVQRIFVGKRSGQPGCGSEALRQIVTVKKCLLIAASWKYWPFLSELIWDFHFRTTVLAVDRIESVFCTSTYLTVPGECTRSFSGS